MARDLLLHDPPRVLAWRLLHDPRLAAVPDWFAVLLPRPRPELDSDPVALLLGTCAVALAATYFVAAVLGARAAVRGALVGLGALVLVALPTVTFVAMGVATQRPYGQDGGVVQLPLALDKILAGESPYGADYSDSILGKQARVSDFWSAQGGNPILRHHAYLPGTHLAMGPFYLASRYLRGAFDPRGVTLLAWVAAAFLAARLVERPERRLAAAAAVVLNPLVYWHQIFGANDLLVVGFLLGAVAVAERHRPVAAGALLGLACATKQLAWPFAPFLLAYLSGARELRDLLGRGPWRRVAAPASAAAAVFLVVVAPVAALDLGRFWGDIIVYNVGLPGADNYPLGGTPGFGFANFILYFGGVDSLRDYMPLSAFYVLLVPLGVLLLRHQLREGRASTVLVAGSAALLASLYVSRVVHANYLVLPAIFLPLGFLMGERRRADVAVVPLLLLTLAVEVAGSEMFRASWEDAVNVRLPRHLGGLAALLAPRAGPHLSLDPLGLAVSATAAGLGLVYLLAGVLGASSRTRQVLVLAGVLLLVAAPTRVLVRIGEATGQPRVQATFAARALSTLRPADAPALREAWSASFRRDPPRRYEPDAPSPAAPALGRALRATGLRDVRPVVLGGLAVAVALLLVLAPPAFRPLALGVAALSPPMAVGVAFGSADALVLASALGAWALCRAGRAAAAGSLVGAVTPLAPGAAFLAPAATGGRGSWRSLAALAAAALGVGALAFALGGPAFRAACGPGLPTPGLGLANALFYWGASDGALASAGAVLGILCLGALVGGVHAARRGLDPLAAATATALVAAVVAPWGSPHDLGTPLLLLALSALPSEAEAQAAVASISR